MAMALIGAIDEVDTGCCFLQCVESYDAFAHGEPAIDAGVLHQHRPARGQVAGAAIAEPSRSHLYIQVLGYAELGSRAADESLVLLGRERLGLSGNGIP